MEKTFSSNIILAKYLYGSNNYNLNTPTSDKDYCYIVMPTREQLFGRELANVKLNEHETQRDVRIFMGNLLKANLNNLEFLFSVEQEYYDGFFHELIDTFKTRYLDSLLKQNKVNFFNAAKGMIFSTLKHDTTLKGWSRALYLVELLDRLRFNDFHMTETIWRPVDSGFAPLVRTGQVQPPSIEELNFRIDSLANFYHSECPNSTNEMVFEHFMNGFYDLIRSYYF